MSTTFNDYFLGKCEDAEEFRLITISLNCFHQLVAPEILDTYTEKVDELLNKNIINVNNPKTITKIIQLLNYPHWSMVNFRTIRKCMLCLIDADLSRLESKEIVIISKVGFSCLPERLNIGSTGRVPWPDNLA